MPETFECPACGAPLELPTEPASSLRCAYCGQQVLIPEEFRVQAQVPTDVPVRMVVDLREAGSRGSWDRPREGRRIGGILAGVIGLIAILSLIPLILIPALMGKTSQAIEMVGSSQIASTMTFPTLAFGFDPEPDATLQPTPTPGFGSLALSFGGEGNGAGLFQDARSIGVDGKGNIYVAEYTGGRVQVFDARGNFITQWLVDGEFPVLALAAGRDGKVYLVQKGEIQRYEGLTGQALGKYGSGDWFEDVYLPLDGGALAVNSTSSDDIFRFGRAGDLALKIQGAISGQTGDAELKMRAVEDGLGNIYALGAFNEGVFKFNSQGKFLNRFGSDGDEPGQFRAAHDLAVDGQGRIYVSDFKGIQVFDSDGRYLALIEVDGPAFGMAFDQQGNLYVAARTMVFRYAIQP